MNVPGISGHTTAIDDYTQNDETNTREDLHETERKLNLAIALYSANIDYGNQDQEDSDPNTDVIRGLVVRPEGNCDTGCCEFERQDDQPVECIIPAHGKTPSRVDEANRVVVE